MDSLFLVLGVLVLAALLHDVRLVYQTQRDWETAQWDSPEGQALRVLSLAQDRAAVARRVAVPNFFAYGTWIIALAFLLLLVS